MCGQQCALEYSAKLKQTIFSFRKTNNIYSFKLIEITLIQYKFAINKKTYCEKLTTFV